MSQSDAMSQATSRMEEEKRKQEEFDKSIKERYVSILDKGERYKPKKVGMNPNMVPTYNQSLAKIFPMQGLWEQKKLLVSHNEHAGVPEQE